MSETVFSEFDKYLIIGISFAVIIGYIIYQVVKGILSTLNRINHPIPHYNPPIIATPPIVDLPYSSPPPPTKGNKLINLLLIITVGLAFFGFIQSLDGSILQKDTIKGEVKEANVHINDKGSTIPSNQKKENEFPEEYEFEAVNNYPSHIETNKSTFHLNQKSKNIVYYLQVSAGSNWLHIYQTATNLHLNRMVFIGVKDTNSPYKIIVGPFQKNEEIFTFKKKNRHILPEGTFLVNGNEFNEIHSLGS